MKVNCVLSCSLCLLCLFSLITSNPSDDYHQEYFGEDDKRISKVWDILENHFYTLSPEHKIKDHWKLYKLVLFTKIERDIGIKYKIFFASNNIKENIQTLHSGVVFCTKLDNKCNVAEYEKLFPGDVMKVNHKKYGIINELIVQWLGKHHQKLLYLIKVLPYEKIILSHNLYLAQAIIDGTKVTQSFIIFEEDNKLTVFAEL